MKKIKFEVAGISDVGIAKEINEDSLIYKVADRGTGFAGIFAIADGVGNLQKGELASSITVTEIIQWWEQDFMNNSEDLEYLKQTLYAAVETANHKLVDLEFTNHLKTASTLSVLFLYDDNCVIYNVGDSRIYRYTHGLMKSKMEQLTKDHSREIEKEVNGARIKKNVLTEYIGKKTRLSILQKEQRVAIGDIYIVCSDGIYKTMSNDSIGDIIRKYRNDMVKICSELVSHAKKNLETDNISVIAVKIKA